MSDKAAGDKLKEQGNAAYKLRNFDEAEKLYEQAWEANKDVVYLNNLAAVYFEKGDYEKAISTAQRAIDEGRDIRADFKIIAKAYARQGSAYAKQEKYDEAIAAFQKSLTEHRTPDVLAKLKEAETTKAETARLAYIDPAKADAARELGNVAFKSGDFAGSVAHYAESIKRNPADARGYTNRAAALTKLMALPDALKDAEKAIEVQPEFGSFAHARALALFDEPKLTPLSPVKGYIRKSHVLFAMKEYSKATSAIEQAAEVDKEGKHTSEIASQLRKVTMADAESRQGETDEQAYARAMRDPEIQQIMSDPVFTSILQQAQNDPASLMQHMKNPIIREKIDKLARAGIIKTR
ncbi:stress-induced-phosphoprotein 1 [Meredithblackwellia eburnea MCA 4105]